jgi:hypothetical protein
MMTYHASIGHFLPVPTRSPQRDPTLEGIKKLGKTNEILRSSVDLLVDVTAIDAFLSGSLRTIAEVLEIPSGYFWKVGEGNWQLHLRYETGL